ncbi:hypothetical protein C8F01DRAFT_1342664 [Mycena amicta]|nr:hypothetical protein C8F01DRAFT_1342664 [Mycena amicta]
MSQTTLLTTQIQLSADLALAFQQVAGKSFASAVEEQQTDDPHATEQSFAPARDKLARLSPDEVARLLLDALKEKTKPSTHPNAVKQLRAAAQVIPQLQRAFGKISGMLGQFDREEADRRALYSPGSASATIQPLRPEWDTLAENFEVIFRDSKRIALAELKEVRQFKNVVLPMAMDPQYDSSVISVIDEFIEGLAKFEDDAERVERRFQELRRDMSTFSTETLAAAFQNAKKELDESALIDPIMKHIKALDAEIKAGESCAFWGWCSLAAGAAGVVGGGAGVFLFATSPLWVPVSLGILGVVFAVAGIRWIFKGDTQGAREKRNELQGELVLLESLDLKVLEEMQKMVETARQHVHSVCKVWNALLVDAVLLRDDLVRLKKGSAEAKLQAQSAAQVYAALEDLLFVYKSPGNNDRDIPIPIPLPFPLAGDGPSSPEPGYGYTGTGTGFCSCSRSSWTTQPTTSSTERIGSTTGTGLPLVLVTTTKMTLLIFDDLLLRQRIDQVIHTIHLLPSRRNQTPDPAKSKSKLDPTPVDAPSLPCIVFVDVTMSSSQQATNSLKTAGYTSSGVAASNISARATTTTTHDTPHPLTGRLSTNSSRETTGSP